MIKNRYDNKLRTGNEAIISLAPANVLSRLITAIEFQKLDRPGIRALEIGCGEGDSAKYMLETSKAKFDLLDISPEMIKVSKKRLAKFSDRITYICQDALEYLAESKHHDVVCSSWTIHNFPWPDKIKLFEAIHKNLKKGGTMLMMDKVYAGKNDKELFNRQIARYKYLDPVTRREITQHEKMDYQDKFRMDEKKLLAVLKKIGFKKLEIADRVERDIVLVAKK